MAPESRLLSKSASEKAAEEGYFEFLAGMGITKHIGSMKATEELVRLCHIREGTYVLDVGCGVGATPCYLARTYNCRVMGVDLLEKMVEQSRARARSLGVEDLVEFKVADARDLPFDDDHFDAVIAESVNAFFEDKLQAIQEYVRVTRPGGYVGITEMTWLRTPPPEVVAYYMKTVYADALEADGWRNLLRGAELEDVVGNAYKLDLPTESRGRIQRYGCRGMMKLLPRAVYAVLKDRASRQFMRKVFTSLPKDMMGDMGYGVYAGRKA
jgi:SAM-dependent methyltransferase